MSTNIGLPAYSSDIEPPLTKDGFVTVFDFELENGHLINRVDTNQTPVIKWPDRPVV
ncbi:TPA: hypothetical protein MYO75_004103 [Citrobacter braakii]|nr:hypothetical protein [Citrobacter braakii]